MSLSKILDSFKEEKTVVLKDGKYVEKSLEGVSLKGVLQRGRLKLEKDRGRYKRSPTFRPSSIGYSYCRRMKIYQLAGMADIWDEPKRPSERIKMDMGIMIHELIQGYFWDVGILKGEYRCLCCKHKWDDISPQVCPNCKAERSCLEFREIKLKDEEHSIFGRCDGIAVVEKEDHPFDIKSIGNRTIKSSDREFCFEDLEEEGPKPDHVAQLMLYLHLLKKKLGHLVYVARNTGQIRSYCIPYDYSIIHPYLEEIEVIKRTAQNLRVGHSVILPAPCGRKDCPCHEIR